MAGCIYRIDIVHEIEMNGLTVGNLLAYSPNNPHADQIVHECTYKVPKRVYYCFNRFIADNARSWQLLDRLIAENEVDDLDAAAIAEKAAVIDQQLKLEFPKELEIEINGVTSSRYIGYPHNETDRSSWGRSSGQMSLEQFKGIIDKLDGYDDILLTIGGFGEPLAHPELAEMVSYAVDKKVLAVNIETDGMMLDEAMSEKLIEAGVGLVTVWVDGFSTETCSKSKPAGTYDYDMVRANIECFVEKAKGSQAMVIPAMAKTHDTLADMEPFYNEWRMRNILSIITGYNSYCGYSEDKSVMNMAPPARFRCNQLDRTMMILADGNVALCCEDYAGKVIIGNVLTDSISSIWQSKPIAEIREQQVREDFGQELCKNCKHWHR